MEWEKVNNTENLNTNHYDTTCPVCREKILQSKLEKIQILSDYQWNQEYIFLLEELKTELEKIKKDKEAQLYVYFCKKHQTTNINSV